MPIAIDDSAGPSERAVRLARVWLSVGGWAWLFLGAGIFVTSGVSFDWVPIMLIGVAVVHFAAARFASRRFAIFFALFGV